MLRKADIEQLSKYQFGQISEIESYKKFFAGVKKKNKENGQENSNNLNNQNVMFKVKSNNQAHNNNKVAFNEKSDNIGYNSYYSPDEYSYSKNLSQKGSGTPFPTIDFSILPSELKVIRFNDFGNGNLYNSIIFLSTNKNWLNSIITRFDLKRKLFVIKLFIQGKPKSVLIDESIPICIHKEKESKESSVAPSFLYSEDQFWMLLIEKAFAKINRSYGNTIRSLASEIIPALTEAPLITMIHNLNKKRSLWNMFNEAAANKNWVIFSEFETMSLEYYSPEHYISYFVINIFKVNKTKYIELTIPENESKTFQQIKQKLQKIREEHLSQPQYFPEVKLKSNKIIYMPFDEFYKSFDKTYILKSESNYHYNFRKFQINHQKYNLVKLKLNTKTKIILTLHLKQTRYFIKFNNYDIPVSRLIVAKLRFQEKYVKIDKMDNRHCQSPYFNHQQSFSVDDSSKEQSIFEEDYEINLDYVNSAYGKQETQIIELDLEDGSYYIFFKVYSEMQFNVVVSTYSDNFIQFEETFDEVDLKLVKNPRNKEEVNSLNNHITSAMNELFSSYLNLKGKTQIIEDDSSMFYSYSLTDCQFGFSILRFENKSKEKILNLVLGFENTGMNLISHHNPKGKHTNQKIKSKSSNTNIIPIQNIIPTSNRSIISNIPMQEISIIIPPLSKELIVFEWDKNFNEISINIRPNFKIDILRPILEEKDFFNKPKTFITNEIFYYEIAYFKGVFIILVNESLKDYFINVEFEKLNNLFIFYPSQFKGLYSLDILLNNRSKYYINLKMINEQDVSYKINFSLKSNNKPVVHSKSTIDKI